MKTPLISDGALIITLSLALAGCAKHRVSFDHDAPVQDEFGVAVQDRTIDIDARLNGLKPRFARDAAGMSRLSSYQWLNTSRRIFEVAEALKGDRNEKLRQQLEHIAQDTSSGFYSVPFSSTQMVSSMTPPGNSFFEEAYMLVKDLIGDKYGSTMTAIEKKVDASVAHSKSAGKSLAAQKDMPLAAAMEVPVTVINEFMNSMSTNEIDGTHEVVTEINATLKKDYVGEIKRLQKITAAESSRETAAHYLARLQRGIQSTNLVPDDDKVSVNKKMAQIVYYAQKLDAIKDSTQMMNECLDLWMAVENRNKMPVDVRKQLEGLFDNLKDKEAIALAEDNKTKWVNDKEWDQIKGQKPRLITAVGQSPALMAYAQKLSNSPFKPAKKDEQAFITLTGEWYNVDFREAFTELRAIARFNDGDLENIKENHTNRFRHPILHIARGRILDMLNKFDKTYPGGEGVPVGFQRMKGYLNNQIIEAVQKEIASAVLEVTLTIPEKISAGIHDSLKGQKVKKNQNVFELFTKFAKTYADKWFFGNNPSLPLIEKENIKLLVDQGQFRSFDGGKFTTAALMGVSLNNTVYRLNSLATAALQPESREARSIGYAAICKMQSLMGYKGFDGNDVPSLMRSINAGHAGTNLNLEKYDAARNVFVVPDNLPIKEIYKPDVAAIRVGTVSVAGQMEMLMGLNKMIRYLKPWRKSTFDPAFSNLRISEVPNQAIFPKDTFFLQALGLASTIIQNLPAKMLGVVSLEGTYTALSQVKNLDSINVVGAVVSDFTNRGPMHTVKTRDMALTILAVQDFLDAIRDLSHSPDPTVRKALATINQQKPLLSKLFLGMSLFAASKLELADGGFATGYDLDQKTTLTAPRQLEDQLLMEQALLGSGTYLKREFISLRAIENFFFLNNRFWNHSLSFYNQDESNSGPHMNLANVALALKNLVMLDEVLPKLDKPNFDVPKSLAQIEKLQKLWIERFFSARTQTLPPLFRVADFYIP